MMRKKYQLSIVLVLVLLIGGEAIYWWIAAERLRAGYEGWRATLVAHGWNVQSASPSMGGWPLSATLTVPNLALRHGGPMVPGDVDVASARVTLAVSLFNPTDVGLSLPEPVHVRLGDLPVVTATGDETQVTLPLRQGNTLPIALHARDLRLDTASGAWHVTVGLLNARVEIASASRLNQSEPAARFSVSSEAIALPPEAKWALGPNISSLSMDGTLNGALPDARDMTRWAEAWRDGGGSLAVTHLAMGWGPLGLTGTATLALDDQLQPMGRGNGRIVGYGAALDQLAVAGVLTRSAALAATAVLSLMAATSDTEQASSVDVPWILQNRTVSMRQVPLVRLPEVDWPRR